jgi:DHA2 family multidrug resistance protein-like MFS transporter
METGGELGGALGIALLGSVGTAVYSRQIGGLLPHGLSDSNVHQARQGLAEAVGVGSGLPGRVGGAVVGGARTAFTHGMNVTAIVGALVLLAAAAATLTLLRGTD